MIDTSGLSFQSSWPVTTLSNVLSKLSDRIFGVREKGEKLDPSLTGSTQDYHICNGTADVTYYLCRQLPVDTVFGPAIQIVGFIAAVQQFQKYYSPET